MLGTYALSAGYYDAYYLKAQKVRTLIKADFDAVWAAGFDAICAPTSPTVAFRWARRSTTRWRCTCRRLHPAGQHGRPAGDLDPGRPVRRAPGRPPDHRSAVERARCFVWPVRYEGITARAPWRDLEPAELHLTDDPTTPSPVERKRAEPGAARGSADSLRTHR